MFCSVTLEEGRREATEAKDSRSEAAASMFDDARLGTLTLIGLGLLRFTHEEIDGILTERI